MQYEQEISLRFQQIDREAQLVMIPIDSENGLVAIVKPYGTGQASCIVFAPATKLNAPFVNYRPEFLRKVLTTDFALREGSWQRLNLDNASSGVLKNSVHVLMTELERAQPSQIKEINMEMPPDTSTTPQHAVVMYRAPERTPFEVALRHLMGVRSTLI